MRQEDATHWTVIRDAADGEAAARRAFSTRYAGVIRAYLAARWQGTPFLSELDDAAQDVFVECFKADGALARASGPEQGRFRTFLYAVVRNVARRFEHAVIQRARREQDRGMLRDHLRAVEPSLSRTYDRMWALAILERASQRHAHWAHGEGLEAERRREVLELRFRKQLAIREIAARWAEDPARVHRMYAQARADFRRHLLDVIQEEEGGTRAQAAAECARLLGCLR